MLAAPYCLSLLLKRVAFRVSTYNPTKRIHKEKVLCCIDEAFVAVSHVKINHPLLLVCPHNRKVAKVHDIL